MRRVPRGRPLGAALPAAVRYPLRRGEGRRPLAGRADPDPPSGGARGPAGPLRGFLRGGPCTLLPARGRLHLLRRPVRRARRGGADAHAHRALRRLPDRGGPHHRRHPRAAPGAFRGQRPRHDAGPPARDALRGRRQHCGARALFQLRRRLPPGGHPQIRPLRRLRPAGHDGDAVLLPRPGQEQGRAAHLRARDARGGQPEEPALREQQGGAAGRRAGRQPARDRALRSARQLHPRVADRVGLRRPLRRAAGQPHGRPHGQHGHARQLRRHLHHDGSRPVARLLPRGERPADPAAVRRQQRAVPQDGQPDQYVRGVDPQADRAAARTGA